MPDEHKFKNPQQNITKLIWIAQWKDYSMFKWDLFQGCQNGSHPQVNKYDTNINKVKHKNNMIMSINVEKAFSKMPHPFIIKIQQVRYRCNVSQHDRGCAWKDQ